MFWYPIIQYGWKYIFLYVTLKENICKYLPKIHVRLIQNHPIPGIKGDVGNHWEGLFMHTMGNLWIEVGCIKLFFRSFSQPLFMPINVLKQVKAKKIQKIRWCRQFSFWDFKIWHFSHFLLILECKEHNFLIFLFLYMLKYVLKMSLGCCWH